MTHFVQWGGFGRRDELKGVIVRGKGMVSKGDNGMDREE